MLIKVALRGDLFFVGKLMINDKYLMKIFADSKIVITFAYRKTITN